MVQNIFMKPDYEEIIKKELNMKSDDKVIIKIEPEDSSYDCYNNSNVIEFVDNTVSYKFIAAEDLVSSNIKIDPSAVLLDVTNAELETRDIVPSEKLLDIKTECNSDFIFEEIDFSEDIKPYLLPVKPNVEIDDEDVKECGLRLDPGNADTNVEQSECVDVDSCDSDEIDVTTVDNGFSTSFRVECQKMLRRQRGRKRPARKHRRQCSVQKEAKGRTSRAKNKGKGVKQNRSKKETMRKSVSAPTTNGTMSPNPTTSWKTRARIRQLIRKYTPSTSTTSSLSSRTSPSSSRSSSPSTDQPDKRLRSVLEKHNLMEKERRKMLKDLMKDLRFLIPEISDQPKTSTVKLLTLSREYINKLKQDQETKQKSIKHLKNKQISILKTLNNLIKEVQDHILNSR